MKYIAYCRKSTDEADRQILSIEAQIAELTEFANREGLEILEFIEESKTAKVPGREKFDSLLKVIEKGHAQGILSWHPDRLARNSIDGGKIIYLLDTGRLLDLKFPSHWFENSPQGKFMLNIAFGQSKYYVDNLSENVKRGLRQKLRNGVYPGKAPQGYINNEKLGTIEVDPVESKIVKKAFQMFSDGGKTFADISRFLFKHEIKGRSGKPLKIHRMKEVLSNKFYIGIITYNGEYYDGKHEQFISKQLFDSVQKQVRLTERSKPNNKHNFAYLGLIKCGECGASITAEQKFKFYQRTNRKAEYIYYRCTKKLGPCHQRFMPLQNLEEQLTKIITDASIPEDWADNWYKRLEEEEILEKQNKDNNLQRLNEEIKTLDQKLNLLFDSYLDNVIDAQTYKNKKNELFEEKLTKNEQITKLQTNGSSWLGPFREFVGSALSCAKIAHAKNTCHDLAIMAKTVGSNFNLLNRQLSVNYNQGFSTICVTPHAQNSSDDISYKVSRERDRGIEPLTFCLESRRSTGELIPHFHEETIF